MKIDFKNIPVEIYQDRATKRWILRRDDISLLIFSSKSRKEVEKILRQFNKALRSEEIRFVLICDPS